MAATGTRSAQSVNGSGAGVVEKAKHAGGSVATSARKAKGPMLTAGATAAGLVGGLALGLRIGSKRRRGGVARIAKAFGEVARELGSATSQVSATTDEVRQVRDQLDKANRQSPVEVLLDGLTHRRGAHRRES